MKRFRASTRVAIAILVLGLVVGGGLLVKKVHAAQYTYPLNSNGGVWASISSTGQGIHLNAPDSYMEAVFSNDTHYFQFTIWDGCFHDGAVDEGSPPSGCVAGDDYFEVCGSTPSGTIDVNSCSGQRDPATWGGGGLFAFNFNTYDNTSPATFAVALNTPTATDNYKHLFLHAHHSHAGGLNGFQVTAGGFANNNFTGPTTYSRIGFTATQSIGAPMSLVHLPFNSGTSTFELKFKVPCSDASGSFNLGWFDADRGSAGIPQDNNVTWEFQNLTTGQIFTADAYAALRQQTMADFMGGNDASRSIPLGNNPGFRIQPSDQYVWRWKNVYNKNGVQVLLPFSEAQFDLPCVTPAAGTLDGVSCGNSGLDIGAWAIDPRDVTRSLNMDFYANGDRGTGQNFASDVLADAPGLDLTDAIFPNVSANRNHRTWNTTIIDPATNAPHVNRHVTIPISTIAAWGLNDGLQHSLYAWAKDKDGSPYRLANSDGSRLFTCPLGAGNEYDLTPKHSQVQTDADKVKVTFTVTNDHTTGTGESRQADGTGVSIEHYVQKNGVTIPATNITDTDQVIPALGDWTAPAGEDVVTVSGLRFGDKVCAYIKVSPAKGITYGAASVASRDDPLADNCITITGKPYVQVWRGDIATGGQFGVFNTDTQRDEPPSTGNCASPDIAVPANITKQGSIHTYGVGPDSSDYVSGSLASYGVQANGVINLNGASNENFYSQVFNFTTTKAKVTHASEGAGFDFSNINAVKGNFAGQKCIHDYYGQFSAAGSTVPLTAADVVSGAVDLGTLANGAYKYTGDLIIKNSSPSSWIKDKHISLAVDGTVRLSDNVSFADASGRLTDTTGTLQDRLTHLPFLLVAVKGNIHVDSSVTRADGVWSAQPDGALGSANYETTGIFDDCVKDSDGSEFTDITSPSFYSECNNATYNLGAYGPGASDSGRLSVEGSVLARKLKLKRLSGDFFSAAVGIDDTSRQTHAAERILPTPEIYFSDPPTNPTSSSGKYDAVEILPPFL